MRNGTVYKHQHINAHRNVQEMFKEMNQRWNCGFFSIVATTVSNIMIITNTITLLINKNQREKQITQYLRPT